VDQVPCGKSHLPHFNMCSMCYVWHAF